MALTTETVTIFIAWMVLNISMNYYNAYVLARTDFHDPFFYTLMNRVTGAAVTGVGGLLGNIRDAVALESQRKVAGVALKMMFTSVNDMLIDEENTPRSLQETVDGMRDPL